jgi:DNA mismatch repair protein MutH
MTNGNCGVVPRQKQNENRVVLGREIRIPEWIGNVWKCWIGGRGGSKKHLDLARLGLIELGWKSSI